ncbi:hypothetical protein QL285_071789 [Trifolium repens]|nr:hypothetical protein QL285_071789 [Trifolium repens]
MQISTDLKNGQRIEYLSKTTHTRYQPYTKDIAISRQHHLTITKSPHHHHQTATTIERAAPSPKQPIPTGHAVTSAVQTTHCQNRRWSNITTTT